MSSTLSAEETRRIAIGSQFWNFYLGNQWGYTRGSVSDDGEEFYNDDPTVTLNYCKAIVDKSTSFLFGKGFSLKFDPDVNDTLSPIVTSVFRDNDMDVKSIMIGQQGSITGDAFIQVAWDEEADDLHPNGKPSISLLPYNTVFPTYDPQNRERMLSCEIKYLVLGEHDEEYVYSQTITKDKITTMHGNRIIEEIPNALGQINIVHIKNMPLAGFCYGQSDLVSILPLQRELNAKVTDVSDIINYHAAPVTIIQGARSKNLERGAKKVWGGLPKDAKVYNLELSSDLNASNNFITMIKKSIHELSNTPEMSLGASGAISNTSGVALQTVYSPLLEKTWIKRMTYGAGLVKVSTLVLKLLHLKGDDDTRSKLSEILDNLETRKKAFSPDVVFADPLPKDEQIQMQLLAQKLNSGLEEPEGALQELGFKGDIKEKLEKIRKYQQEKQDMMFDTGYSGNTPIEHQFGGDAGIQEFEE